MTIQTIQQTSKKWKLTQLIGGIGACLGVVLAFMSTDLLIVGGVTDKNNKIGGLEL